MKQYLIDTNICIFYTKGFYRLHDKFKEVGVENCFISEITLAELKFGVANSQHPKKNKQALNNFLTGIQIIPISQALDLYAEEKARLRKQGTPVDDFDLLIGTTAATYNLTLVTNNYKHFQRLNNISLEDWTK